jgi:hypothetical protein
MSASLENQFISDRYTSLLHLSASSLTGNLDYVYDGLGNQTPLEVSTEKVVVKGITISLETFFPVNSIQFTADNVNPGTRITGTVWELVSQGRYLAGVGTGLDINNDQVTINEGSNSDNVGEYGHHLTIDELPEHSHSLPISDANGIDRDAYGQGISNNATRTPRNNIVSGVTGGSDPHHNNMPPYFGLYVWKRTS